MPKVFITMVDYFDPKIWPILGFNSPRRLEKLVEQYDEGDLVFHIGRKGENQYAENKGKILGVATFHTQKVVSKEYLSHEQLEEFKNEKGEFRWPIALVMKRAWEFTEKPNVKSIIKQHIPNQYIGSEAVRWGEEAYGRKWGDENDMQELLSLWSNKGNEVTFDVSNNQRIARMGREKNPNVFITLINDFTPDIWPVVGFPSAGRAEKLIRNSGGENDIVVHVATLGSPTSSEKIGRILGAATFEKDCITTDGLLDPKIMKKWLNKEGKFRWPFAVKIKQAWAFPTPAPIATEHITEPIPYRLAAAEAVKWNNEADIEAILSLLKNDAMEVEVGKSPDEINMSRNQEKFRRKKTRPKGHTKGFRRKGKLVTIDYKLKDTAFTYALRFAKTNLWKIGKTTCLARRLDEIDTHVPAEILDEQNWELWEWKTWVDKDEAEDLALDMEQEVLKILKHKRTRYERVHCTEEELRKAWKEAIRIIEKV